MKNNRAQNATFTLERTICALLCIVLLVPEYTQLAVGHSCLRFGSVNPGQYSTGSLYLDSWETFC